MSVPSGFVKIAQIGYADCGGYQETKRYYKNQVVHYYGFPYICISETSKGHYPSDPTYWKPMVASEDEED